MNKRLKRNKKDSLKKRCLVFDHTRLKSVDDLGAWSVRGQRRGGATKCVVEEGRNQRVAFILFQKYSKETADRFNNLV